MNNQEDRPFLTIKEVSELLGISVSTINRLIKQRDFPKKLTYHKEEWFLSDIK